MDKPHVVVADDVSERHLSDIERLVQQSELSRGIKERAISVFRRLGQVEADIHGTSLDEVHLHELGGVDTIVDVVGTLSGLEAMGIDIVVIRHSAGGAPHLLSECIDACVVNAGDGYHEHPTQGLLDIFTMRELRGSMEGMKKQRSSAF